jgi:hypothetical protein
MKTKQKKKVISLLALGTLLLSMQATSANAASFEQMKDNVENGTGVVYNEDLQREMTVQETADYIKEIDAQLKDKDTNNLTVEESNQAIQKASQSVAQKALGISKASALPLGLAAAIGFVLKKIKS